MARTSFNRNVFINCPMDDAYNPMFQAIIFTIHMAGFRPRCSKEANDSGDSRLEKIINLIKECKFGIHDISRTELNDQKLPRFNMPLELGIDLGFKNGGNPVYGRKKIAILDTHQYRYQAFISDLSGRDPFAHRNRPKEVITIVRDWLRTASNTHLPSGSHIHKTYVQFKRNLPKICYRMKLIPSEITFLDYTHIVAFWLKELEDRKKKRAALLRRSARSVKGRAGAVPPKGRIRP